MCIFSVVLVPTLIILWAQVKFCICNWKYWKLKVQYLSTIISYLNFTWVFPFSATVYFRSCTSWREILSFLLNYKDFITFVACYYADCRLNFQIYLFYWKFYEKKKKFKIMKKMVNIGSNNQMGLYQPQVYNLCKYFINTKYLIFILLVLLIL